MLSISDEFSTLKDLCVCKGESIPEYQGYENTHPEFSKYYILPWSRRKFLKQQEEFFLLLEKYRVNLHFLSVDKSKPWQAYTRDIGFVINDKLFYSEKRNLPEREGEVDEVLKDLPFDKNNSVVKILNGSIEGGDVLVHEGRAFVGVSARTSIKAVLELSNYVDVTMLDLGSNIMHLDTRLTFLPRGYVLIYPPAFKKEDLNLLGRIFKFITINSEECKNLGANIFCLNPETLVIHSGHKRLAKKLSDAGFEVETIDYSEPISLAGSFRCTTMPLRRA